MKITTLILITVILHVSATTLAQKVSLSAKKQPLSKIFEDISNQTGFDFAYTSSTLDSAKPVTITVKNAELNNVLKKIFSDQPLTYTIESQSVVISAKEAVLVKPSEKLNGVPKIQAAISGTVTDTLGNPLIGASVMIKGTAVGAHTDGKGHFALPSMIQGTYIIVVNYVGYEKLERTVYNGENGINIHLILHAGTTQLDQVQVIAYGSDTKRLSVGSVSTITAQDIEKQPVTNPLLALQGQAPGLAVTATSGAPGSQVLVQIRGQNTLSSTGGGLRPYTQPLFIVDGVPFAAQNNNVNQLSTLGISQFNLGGLSQSGGISPFNNINPADIESISILRDADATSIYGTQGSNGAIIITTKKGKAGPTTFDLNVNTQFNSNSRPIQLLNTAQYLQFRRDAYASDNLTPSNSQSNYLAYAPDVTIFDQNKYTDWGKTIYGKNTNNTNIHADLSGGTATNTFRISAGYTGSTYNYPGDFADKKWSLHSNLHHLSNNKRLAIDLTTDYGYDQNNYSTGFSGGLNTFLPPNLPDLADPSGKLIWVYQGVDLSQYQFYASLKKTSILQNYNFNTAFNISYKLVDGLTLGANMGYNRNTTAEHAISPAAAQNPAYPNISSIFANNNYETINIEPQLNYNKNFGKSVFNVLLGGTYRKNINLETYVSGTQYPNDNFLGSINGAAKVTNSNNSSLNKYNAGFLRLKYIYNSEFVAEVTGRRDGSSNFGPGNQFGNFGSVGGGWIFTEEDFFKKNLSVLDYGKISATYGTSGSDGVAPYQYQALYKPILYIPTFQGIVPSAPYNLYNPNYSWAFKKSLNIALDLGLFNNRLLLNATYYRDHESNQLVAYPLSAQTGFTSVLGNLGATIQNKGFEFTVTSTNIKTKAFSWNTSFNITFNRNELVSFPNLALSGYSSQYIIGQPVSVMYGFKYSGVNPTTGLFEYYNKNGGLTSSPVNNLAAQGGDLAPIGNQEIKYMGGIGNTFTYKQFSLYVFCQFSSRNAPNYLFGLYATNPLGLIGNVPLAVQNNFWKTPGDVAQLQRLSSNYSSAYILPALNFSQSSGAYSDDTYLRVKTLSLSYTLPADLLKKVGVKGAAVNISGQNLLTFTNYKVGDPEQPGAISYFPIQRIIAFGLDLKF